MAAPLRAVRPAGTWAGSWVHTDSAPVGPRITSLPPTGLDNAALTRSLISYVDTPFPSSPDIHVTHGLCVRDHPPGRWRTLGWVDSTVAVAVPT